MPVWNSMKSYSNILKSIFYPLPYGSYSRTTMSISWGDKLIPSAIKARLSIFLSNYRIPEVLSNFAKKSYS